MVHPDDALMMMSAHLPGGICRVAYATINVHQVGPLRTLHQDSDVPLGPVPACVFDRPHRYPVLMLQTQHLAGGSAAGAGARLQGAGPPDDGRGAAADGALRPLRGAAQRVGAARHPAADPPALPVPKGEQH